MTTPVKFIDFLPDKYRQATKRRRTSYWRGIVVVMFVGVFAACALSLSMVDRDVRAEHEHVSARHREAVTHDLQMKMKADKLAALREYADLLTFLRHPWPRSRILEDLFRSVPSSVTIDKLRLTYEARPGAKPVVSAESTEATSHSAATDLADLRAIVEAQDSVVHLEGTTKDQPGLHAYLQSLSGNGLFVSAEVTQIEAVRTADVSTSKFMAHVVMRPGWGLPGGPTLEELAQPPKVDEPTIAVVDRTAPVTEALP